MAIYNKASPRNSIVLIFKRIIAQHLNQGSLTVNFKPLFPKIQFIHILLVVFLSIQCIGITNPPLEIGHNWRQTVTAMIARNLQNNGFNLFNPQIDFAGNTDGTIGSEFPAFQAIIAVFNSLFGYQHWQGRWINLLISTWGVWSLYQFLLRTFSQRIAQNTSAILLFSVWFSFSRKVMPDTFSIALVLIGIRQAQLYLHSVKLRHLVFMFLSFSLAVLSKLPAIAWLATLVFIIPKILEQHKRSNQLPLSKTDIRFIIACLISIIPGLIWYFYWVPLLNKTFQLYYPKSLTEGLSEIIPHWRLLFEKFYFTAFYSFAALLLFLLGLVYLFNKNYSSTYLNKNIESIDINNFKKIKLSFLAFVIVFGIFIIKTGDVFPKHTYYIIPFMPFMAFIAALGLEFIYQKTERKQPVINTKNTIQKPSAKTLLTILLLVANTEALLNQVHELSIKPTEKYKLELELIGKTLPSKSLIVSNAGVNPQELYFLDHKGWVRFPQQLHSKSHLDSLTNCNAEFLVINKNFEEPRANYNLPIYSKSESFLVYQLDKEPNNYRKKNK